jgi:hypothetical protein
MKPPIIESKACTKCGEIKPPHCFVSTHNKKDYLSHQCKDCINAAARERTKNLSEEEKKKRNNRTIALRERNRHYVYSYLAQHPCVDCGEDRIGALEFDHVRGNKLDTICNMVRHANSLERIQQEIAKCDVRCANCHRIKTSNQFGFSRASFHYTSIDKPMPPKPTERTEPKIVERFWTHVDINPNPHACWLWKHPNKKGKKLPGIFRLNAYLGTARAYKYAWEITYGVAPTNMLVNHTCTNILCCNPSHLFLGTKKDNAVARELKHRGEPRTNHKLTITQVREIRKSNLSNSQLSRLYGVSRRTIDNVRRGITWKHVMT